MKKQIAKKPVVSQKVLMAEARKPFAEREAIGVGRGGVGVQPRNYWLSDHEAAAMRAENKKPGAVFKHPYRGSGKYAAFLDALIALGINKRHTFAEIKEQMKEIMSARETTGGENSWKAFCAKTDRGEGEQDTALDVNAKIQSNALVLQRLGGQHPYGMKLAQLHACVNIYVKDEMPEYELDTKTFTNAALVKPINETKRRGLGTKKAKAPKVAAAAPKTAKPAKAAAVKAKPTTEAAASPKAEDAKPAAKKTVSDRAAKILAKRNAAKKPAAPATPIPDLGNTSMEDLEKAAEGLMATTEATPVAEPAPAVEPAPAAEVPAENTTTVPATPEAVTNQG